MRSRENSLPSPDVHGILRMTCRRLVVVTLASSMVRCACNPPSDDVLRGRFVDRRPAMSEVVSMLAARPEVYAATPEDLERMLSESGRTGPSIHEGRVRASLIEDRSFVRVRRIGSGGVDGIGVERPEFFLFVFSECGLLRPSVMKGYMFVRSGRSAVGEPMDRLDGLEAVPPGRFDRASVSLGDGWYLFFMYL